MIFAPARRDSGLEQTKSSAREMIMTLTTREYKQIEKRSKPKEKRLRMRHPEVHGKVVDFITHTIDDGILYFTVRFKDKTSFCLRYACEIVAVGTDLSNWRSGDFHIVREYMKPLRR